MFGWRSAEARWARESAEHEAKMRACLEPQAHAARIAPPFDANAKCVKCGGSALPSHHGQFTMYGVTFPERIMMTCGCGYRWPMKPLDAPSADDALSRYANSAANVGTNYAQRYGVS